MAAGNSTSTTITFVVKGLDSSGGGISVELDEAKNNGKSQFESGDTVYFKVFCSPSSMSVTPYSSDGSVTLEADSTCEVKDQLVFALEKEASLSKPATGALTSYKWLGKNNGGSLSLNSSGTSAVVSTEVVAVCDVAYNATYKPGSLSGVVIPSDIMEYPVVVVLVGTLT